MQKHGLEVFAVFYSTVQMIKRHSTPPCYSILLKITNRNVLCNVPVVVKAREVGSGYMASGVASASMYLGRCLGSS
jgi:hypothetical protein